MEPQQPVYDAGPDDTEGHRLRGSADAEGDETDDAEGHGFRRADAERDETDDTEGHRLRGWADAERDETDDTEGHGIRKADAEQDEGEDVAGHLSGALGKKKKTEHEF